MSKYGIATAGAQSPAQIIVSRQAPERSRQRNGIAGWDEQTGHTVADDLVDRPDVGGHQR